METRALGGSGIEVTRVILGCGNFGGIGSSPAFFGQGTSREEAFRLMDVAWERGITTFDTADAYGGGRSETCIGEWLATKGADVRDRIVIATKTYNPMDAGAGPRSRPRAHPAADRDEPAPPRRRARRALPRARLRPRDTAGGDDAGLRRARRAGKVGAVGASNFTGEQLAEALELAELEGLPRYEWVQNGFSLLDQGDRESVFPVCREHGLGYTPVQPARGRLADGQVPARASRCRPARA